eukprot:CAMPEP_0116010950 /NCGR_PEP_ID=MMETSP0321-20121206/4289_1 /TAXON_ID=163516 /ORGANISM="Leptocylindrus danicus var. danicus, Strain B650" /LENGTH=252 /DNA_ID=CAMNT_0003480113 /DNA_START=97 /DNA_END=855 /DNA_ORIENTATION=+
MVRAGQFLMELVRADDKTQKFLEHIGPLPDREHYIEVEPDVEYFIRIKADTPSIVLAYLSVDGEELGYHSLLKKKSQGSDDDSQFKGIWTRSGGITTMTALRFHRTMIRRPDDANTDAPPQMWTGKVTARFFEAIRHGISTQEDFRSTWSAHGKVGATIGINTMAEKKGVMSSKGESNLRTEEGSGRFVQYRKGRELCTISAKYCCTPGLIANGILPRYVRDANDTHTNAGSGRRRQRRKTGESSHVAIDLT